MFCFTDFPPEASEECHRYIVLVCLNLCVIIVKVEIDETLEDLGVDKYLSESLFYKI